MVKQTKRKTNRNRSKNSRISKKWRKFKPQFFQKVGAITIFILVLFGLFAVLTYKFTHTTPPTKPDIVDEQGLTTQQKEYFLNQIAPSAQKLQREYGVLASISMAQAALESNFGSSQLSSTYNNLYGVKTDITDGDGVNLPTLEYIDGEMVERSERFKVYPSWDASMRAHAELIYYGTTWNSEYYSAVKNGKTYQEQAKGLQTSGYATDPDYADKIIQMIETWNLNQYDQPIAN